jgi:hypothetical protein
MLLLLFKRTFAFPPSVASFAVIHDSLTVAVVARTRGRYFIAATNPERPLSPDELSGIHALMEHKGLKAA